MLYCVRIEREMEEVRVMHYRFNKKPTRDEILKKIMNEDIGYDDNYGKFDYWQVD